MALAPGTRLGAYEILTLIGAGGMGEVYRARDARLDRAVAIKVLAPHIAADSQVRDRFEREARTISSLNHPHICVLHDIGREGDIDFLVLELLEGQTLAERLQRGPLAVNEAIQYGVQICDALDKAHRSGIVHRDLKPANVILTKSGAKLLDFGLAKPAAPVVATTGLSMLPTTPPGLTSQGTILGTFQYMAPEQIEGLEADARTDMFAFGSVLFEMIVGRPAFEGKTRASLLGAILKDTPPRVSTFQPLSPRPLDRIIATCLEKDPEDRYQSSRDLLRDLRSVGRGEDGGEPRSEAVGAQSWWTGSAHLAWATSAVLAVAVAVLGLWTAFHVREPHESSDSFRFTIQAPLGATFGAPSGGGTGVTTQVAVSPDGKMIVFGALDGATVRLYVRSLAALDAQPLAGTEDGAFPFWSPDSRQIGFFSHGKLQKVPVGGGMPLVLCDAAAGRGGTWNRDNVIVFTPSTSGPLQRVSAAGGIPVPASALDSSYGETNHRFPQFLPDGRHFLYVGTTGTCCPASKSGRIKTGTLDGTDTAVLLSMESAGLYASGHLLFNRAGTLMAQRFDAATRRLSGDPFPIASGVGSEGSRYMSAAVSDTGVLVYATGLSRPTATLTWVDRTGHALRSLGEARAFASLAFSPDERRVAASFFSGTPENRDIWLIDVAGGTETRFTFDPGDDNFPVWSPDGRRLAFYAGRDGAAGTLRQKALEGATNDAPIAVVGVPGTLLPTSWSPDGANLLFTRGLGVGGSSDIWVLQLASGKATALVETRAAETNAVFSPDGKWFAYQSSESGQPEIFVQPFPPTGGKFQVSRKGGVSPQWRRDGKELYFLGDSKLMTASIDTTSGFSSTVPTELFSVQTMAAFGGTGHQFVPAQDGQRFLISAVQQVQTLPLTVLVNWPSTIQR